MARRTSTFTAITNWALALRDANYDYKLVIGTEAHNSKHGSAILPDALRWLWRDYPKPIAKPAGGPRHYISNNIVLDSDPGWELVSQGHKFTEGPAVDAHGECILQRHSE